MQSVAKKSIAIASAFGVAGVSSLFFGAAAANAEPVCANGGTLVSGTNICELTIDGNNTESFEATSDMTQLEVLLVGGGGNGGYSGGGGGGSVKIVDFDGGSAPTLSIVSGAGGSASTVSEGTTTATANPGTTSTDGSKDEGFAPGKAGVSGNGHAGAPEDNIGGGGGGAGASPTSRTNGGAGRKADAATVKNLAGDKVTPVYPLFKGDTNCYGGGGAVGTDKKAGTAGCNAGSVSEPGGTVNQPTDNMGGGGSAFIETPVDPAYGNYSDGADGVVVIRWNATPQVSLSFNDGSHGHTPSTEHLLTGDTPTKPSNPSVSGYKFLGWFTDPTFETAANFTTPIAASEIFYGKFQKK
jgi:hypothetical protein